MTNETHTPTPWKLKPEEAGRNYVRIRGTALGGRYKIANVICPSYDGMHEREIEQTRANAAFIVRACNAHDELVEALSCALECAEQNVPNFDDVFSMEIAVLAKARGEV